MSTTQQQILSTMFIIRPVSTDHTDFIRDLTKFISELPLYQAFTVYLPQIVLEIIYRISHVQIGV